jgi:pimeloyl-ACP methyl ester carboxylesterase
MAGKLDRTISALNAVVGDYLRRRASGLEIAMGFYDRGEQLACDGREIARAHPGATGRVCILVHGLGDNEGVWRFPGKRDVSYGSLLQKDLAYTPFYLRYNTGLHISENGEALADLLETLVERHPVPVREIVVLGHSMGGLVIRSACEAGMRSRRCWVERLTHAFYIGSPHLGAPLEKLGNAVGRVLRGIRNPYVKLVADVVDLRSSGIKDLRHANIVREHWEALDAGAPPPVDRIAIPLLPGIAHHAVVGTLTARERHVITLLFGDALVRVPSAVGRCRDEERALRFPEENVKVFHGVNHRRLAHDRKVYRQIRAWCAGATS